LSTIPIDSDEIQVVANEDGIALGLPLNVRAWHLVGMLVQRTPIPDMSIMAPIVGDVYLCGPTNDEGIRPTFPSTSSRRWER
jgi:hypothetical protein